MRSEQEMYDLILSYAERDERVRAVLLNGSRANPDAPRDAYQDYDVVYLVRELAPFCADESWLDVFGKRLIKHRVFIQTRFARRGSRPLQPQMIQAAPRKLVPTLRATVAMTGRAGVSQE